MGRYDFYVYRVTHSSGQFYYGSRSSKVAPNEDLWKKYFTSSKRVKSLIKSDGLDSFVAEIIDESLDGDAIYWTEQRLIKESVKNPLCRLWNIERWSDPAVRKAHSEKVRATRKNKKTGGDNGRKDQTS